MHFCPQQVAGLSTLLSNAMHRHGLRLKLLEFLCIYPMETKTQNSQFGHDTPDFPLWYEWTTCKGVDLAAIHSQGKNEKNKKNNSDLIKGTNRSCHWTVKKLNCWRIFYWHTWLYSSSLSYVFCLQNVKRREFFFKFKKRKWKLKLKVDWRPIESRLWKFEFSRFREIFQRYFNK